MKTSRPPPRVASSRRGPGAWAGVSPALGVLVSDRFWWQPVLPGLGPPRSAQREACGEARASHRRSAATVSAAAATQRGGLAVSRLDGRGLSRRTASRPDEGAGGGSREGTSRSRTLFRGSRVVRPPLPADWRRAGSGVPRCRGSLTPRCGTPLAATITPIAGWAFSRPRLGWPCRWPPAPAVPAIACFARLFRVRGRTPYQEPFPISPVTFVPDDEGKYTRRAADSRKKNNSLWARNSPIHATPMTSEG
jgi:hypothetical protein